MDGKCHFIVFLLFVHYAISQNCDCKLLDILRNIVQREMTEREMLVSRVEMLESKQGTGTNNGANSSGYSSDNSILERLSVLESMMENFNTKLNEITMERQSGTRLNSVLLSAWKIHKHGVSVMNADVQKSIKDNNIRFNQLTLEVDKHKDVIASNVAELINQTNNMVTKQMEDVEKRFEGIRSGLNNTLADYVTKMDKGLAVFLNQTDSTLNGIRAEIKTNECASNPCWNGATCVDGIQSYTCICLAGYSGSQCQINKDECSSNPCLNGATCVDGINSYSCKCQVGYVYVGGYCQAQFPVAFTVGHDRHFEIGSTPNRLDVPYALTLFNHGGNLNHGVFTCQEDGLYKFQAYALTKTNAKLFLEVLKNNDVVASLWGHTPGDYASAGNAVVLQLSAGDVVKVVTRASHEMALYGQQGQIYITFSGVQLDSPNTNPRAGFSAYLDHSMLAAHDTTLVLTPTHTNVNHVYDGNGKSNFNAPADGLYIFHLFGLAEKNAELWLEIHQQHSYKVSIYGKTDQDWANAGNSVILHLAHRDAVYIRTRRNRDSNLYGRPDQQFTTWSGVQLPDGTHAFSAGLTHNQNFAAGSTVVFDRVFVNTDGIYNAGNGIMTVHRAGLYEFNAHALGQKNAKIWLDLYRNGGYEVSLYGHNPNHYGAASNSVVLQLFDGDHVFVKAHNEAQLYGANDQIYCTFSGYLIQ